MPREPFKADRPGGVVYCAAMSHAPHILAFPERAPQAQRESIHQAMHAVGRDLRGSDPDAIVIISSDHFSNFSQTIMPAFAIGMSNSYTGPSEDWLGVPPREVTGAAELARRIARHCTTNGVELATVEGLELEHGMMVPLQFLDLESRIPIVPIIQNCIAPPLPTLERCYLLGTLIAAAAEEAGTRVAVIGAGGLSHAPGAPSSQVIDEKFDHEFLELLASGYRGFDDLGLTDDRIDAAGFGTWEIRQWFTAWGAAGGVPARTLAYEPVVEWETGCAVATFDVGTERREAVLR
jgi:aromatic ring-opening dioxygenase catalytic subunit (LigB family)